MRKQMTSKYGIRLLTFGTLNEENIEVVPVLQEKTASPTKSMQNITPDERTVGLSKVIVNPIPNQYIVPEGSLLITENGTYDATQYASVIIAIQYKLGAPDVELDGDILEWNIIQNAIGYDVYDGDTLIAEIEA